MKTNIIQTTIDFNHLDFSLQEFFHTHGYSATYIVTSQETINLFAKEAWKKFDGITLSDNHMTLYKGIKVAICNGLKFGEVDIV